MTKIRIDHSIICANSAIFPGPGLHGTLLDHRPFDLLLGYEAAGFMAASILALLNGLPCGLLRRTRKIYGLERILEAAEELDGRRIAVLHSEDMSAEAVQALGQRNWVPVCLGAAERAPDWSWPSTGHLRRLRTETRPHDIAPRLHSSDEGFVLSSGDISTNYYDVFTDLLDPGYALACAERSGVDLPSYDSIVGMAKGGIFFAVFLAALAGTRPVIMDHGKIDRSPLDRRIQLGRTLLVDETVGTGDYFRIAAEKLANNVTSIDYLVAQRFRYRGDYPVDIMSGGIL